MTEGARTDASAAAPVDAESIVFTGSLETSQLVAQVESLRGAVRFLRRENGFLKSRGLLDDLAPLPHVNTAPPPSDERRALVEERHAIAREAVTLAANARVVDLTLYTPGPVWQRAARRPENQYAAQQDAVRKLLQRLDGVRSRMATSGSALTLPLVTRVA